MNNTALELFLLINVFLIGALAVIAFQHAWAHFRPQHHEEDSPKEPRRNIRLPRAVRKRLLDESQANFKSALNISAKELESELKSASNELTGQLRTVGNEIMNDEMKRYRERLDTLREQLDATVGKNHDELINRQAELLAQISKQQAELESSLATKRTELEAKLTEEISAEKDRLLVQIDTKLADAIASFLNETLQHNIDLGAQNSYLMSMLEEHKDELKKEVKNET